MLVCLVYLLRVLLNRAEHSCRDAYLASSADIFQLERRMRLLETND